MSKRYFWQDAETDAAIKKAFDAGLVIVSSTDTVLGLLAPLTNQARAMLDSIKERSSKPYIILVHDYEKATHFSDAFVKNPTLKKLCEQYWPGPLTVIVPAKKTIPQALQSDQGTLAIRVPQHAGLRTLLMQYDGLFSTSANRSGDPIPCTLEELDPRIARAAAFIVIDETMPSDCIPSTIIDCTGDQIKVIREGACIINEITG